MSNTYRPVQKITLVNTTTRNAFYTISLTTHNVPLVTMTFGRLGTKGNEKRFYANSREEAREYFDSKVDEKLNRGYVLVQAA